MPVAAVTALQVLRDHGHVQAGQKVLINGASGGVGTFAVQIAKALGAEVTAVCSTGNVEQARSLGADRVIDYRQEDFTRGEQLYDLMIDIVGNRAWSACKRVLAPKATVVLVGGAAHTSSGGWRVIGHLAATRLASLFGSRRSVFFIAAIKKADLLVLREQLAKGKMKAVIDRRYPLSDVAAAFSYFAEGHAKGKIVLRQ